MTTNRVLIQVFSDIHIESWNNLPEIPAKAKYLFLVGDICFLNHPLFFRFLDYCSKTWIKTFYIPGNHEYYNKKKNYNELEFEYKLKIGEKYKNVFYLNNDFISLDEENINIYGSTFWTIPPFKDKYQAKTYIKDYNEISYYNQNKNEIEDLTVTFVKKLANESFNSLQKYLNETNKKTIVMTHFPPHKTGTSNPEYIKYEKIMNSYFAWPDDTLNKFKKNNIICWISGHTHWSYDFEQDGIRLISNQVGYISEMGDTGVNEDGIYEITIS
jgi:predicted phosphohydrolase